MFDVLHGDFAWTINSQNYPNITIRPTEYQDLCWTDNVNGVILTWADPYCPEITSSIELETIGL